MSDEQTIKDLNKSPFLLRVIGMGVPYFVKTPWWLKKIYPHRLWNADTKKKIIYLTFDDGPHPVATPFVLDELKKYNAMATFFCIGKNVVSYPFIYKRIIDENHTTGNHTQTHPSGWETKTDVYLADVAEAAKHIQSNLFRPPFGRIKSSQVKGISEAMKNTSSKIIMWDVLSGDFDELLSKEKCLKNVIENATEGSIIVFHDSEKAFPKVEYVLPETLRFFSEKGYIFRSL